MHEIVDYLMKQPYKNGYFERIESLNGIHVLTFSRRNEVFSYMIQFTPGRIEVNNLNHTSPHKARVKQHLLQEIYEKLKQHPRLRLRFITGEMELELHK